MNLKQIEAIRTSEEAQASGLTADEMAAEAAHHQNEGRVDLSFFWKKEAAKKVRMENR